MKYNDQPLLFGKLNSVIMILLVAVLSGSCDSFREKKYESPAGYDLNNPVVIKLPLELDEISGVAFYLKDTSVFAINDEFGMLYKIFLNHPQDIQKWRFSKGADFEDLVLLDSNFYVLNSNGNIEAFKFLSNDSIYYSNNKFPLSSGDEFEILYYDNFFKKLMLICKDCETDKKKFLSTYSFDPFTFQFANDSFRIDVKSIAKMIGEDKIKFKPSAASIHPVTGELYIVSSVNKLLVIADRKGNVRKVYKIDKGLFKQPEGITFTPAGTMIISNESAKQGVANILIFPYNSKTAKEHR